MRTTVILEPTRQGGKPKNNYNNNNNNNNNNFKNIKTKKPKKCLRRMEEVPASFSVGYGTSQVSACTSFSIQL